jgi:Tol biopolymer transport system component
MKLPIARLFALAILLALIVTALEKPLTISSQHSGSPPPALEEGSGEIRLQGLKAASVLTSRVSVASDGAQGNGESSVTSISADGRYVVFISRATNLVANDTNTCDIYTIPGSCPDVFVHDRQTGETTRVSVASDGTQANYQSIGNSISTDGRFVAFASLASNLVSGDTNICGVSTIPGTCPDVFVHDRQTGETTRVSVASNGTQGNAESWFPSISADARYVAFVSPASNLVSGDTNGVDDVFVHDRQTGQTTRVSVASNGTQGDDWSSTPSISADGRYVSFNARAGNLVANDTNTCEDYPIPGSCPDIFVHDQQTGGTTRVSVASDGTQGNGASFYHSISADGRYVAFYSEASNLVSEDTNGFADIFVHDRQTGETTRVSIASDGTQGNGWSYVHSISAHGNYVAFTSYASNLVGGDTNTCDIYTIPGSCPDVFVHDRQAGVTARVSVSTDGTQGDDSSYEPSLSADGSVVAFTSRASNLVSEDDNQCLDVFVHESEKFELFLPFVIR